MHSQEAIPTHRGEEEASQTDYIKQLRKELAILKLRLYRSQDVTDISTDEIKVSTNSISKNISEQALSLKHVQSEDNEVKVSEKLVFKPNNGITVEYELQQVLDLKKVPHVMQETNIKEISSQGKKVVVERRMSQNEYIPSFKSTKKRASIVRQSTYDLAAFTKDLMPTPTSTKTILPMFGVPSPTSIKKTFPIPHFLETADEYQALLESLNRLKLENGKLEENIAMQEKLISKLRTKITEMSKEVYYVGKGDTIVMHAQKSKPLLYSVGLPAGSEDVNKLKRDQLYNSRSQVAMIHQSQAVHLENNRNHDSMDIMLKVKKNDRGHDIQNPVTMRQMLAEAAEYDLIAEDSSDEVLSMGGLKSKAENRLSAKSQRSPLDHQNELERLRAKNEVIENNSHMQSKMIEMLKSDLEKMQNEALRLNLMRNLSSKGTNDKHLRNFDSARIMDHTKEKHDNAPEDSLAVQNGLPQWLIAKWASDGIMFDKIPTTHDFGESKSGSKIQKRKGTNNGAKPRNVAVGLEEALIAACKKQESTIKSLKQIRQERDKALKRCKKHRQYIKSLQKENKRRLVHIRTLEEKMEVSLLQSRRAKSLSFHKLKKEGLRIDVEKITPYRPDRQNWESDASGDSEILSSEVEDENDHEMRIGELQQLKLQVLKLERDGLVLNPEIRSLINESKSETMKTPIHIEDVKKEHDFEYWKTAVDTELEAKYSKAKRTISTLKSSIAHTENKLEEALAETREVKLERDRALKQVMKWKERYNSLETEKARLNSHIRYLEESLQAHKKNSPRIKNRGGKRGYEKKEAEDFERYLKSEKADDNQKINTQFPLKKDKSSRFSFRWGRTPNKWKHSKAVRYNSKQQTSNPFEDDWQQSEALVRMNADASKRTSPKHKSLVHETRDNPNSSRQRDKIEKRRPRSISRSPTAKKISSTRSPSERMKRSRSSRNVLKSKFEQRDRIKKVNLRSVSTGLQNSLITDDISGYNRSNSAFQTE